MEKECPDCGESKSADQYGRNKSRPDGLAFYCKSCFSKRAAATYRRKQARLGKTVRERIELPAGYKRCPSCEEIKPHSAFHRAPRSWDGLSSHCADCRNAAGRAHYLWRSYGFNEEQVRRLIEGQGNVCVICLRAKPVHVDHDHATGAVRAVLCFNCNAALGHLKDNPNVLRRATRYVEGEVWRPTLTAPGVYRLPS